MEFDNLPNGVSKSAQEKLLKQEKLLQGLQPAIKAQEILDKVGMSHNEEIKNIDIMNSQAKPVEESIADIRKAAMPTIPKALSAFSQNMEQYSQGTMSEIAKFMIAALEKNKKNVIVENLSNSLSYISQIISYIPMKNIYDTLYNLGYTIELNRYEKIYCAAVYEAEWFPYLDFTSEQELFLEINQIIATSQLGSKNQKSRINKIFFKYYTSAKVQKIKKSWRTVDIESHYKRIIRQAVDAYLRGEYALTIPCLATLWETFIFRNEEKKHRKSQDIKKHFEKSAEKNGKEKSNHWIIDFYNNMLMGQCYNLAETNPDLPQRHGFSHGWLKKYPSKKAALNAILFTDFLLKLEPIEVNNN